MKVHVHIHSVYIQMQFFNFGRMIKKKKKKGLILTVNHAFFIPVILRAFPKEITISPDFPACYFFFKAQSIVDRKISLISIMI